MALVLAISNLATLFAHTAVMQCYITTIEEKRHKIYYSYYNKQNNPVICIKLPHAITVNYLIILFYN